MILEFSTNEDTYPVVFSVYSEDTRAILVYDATNSKFLAKQEHFEHAEIEKKTQLELDVIHVETYISEFSMASFITELVCIFV